MDGHVFDRIARTLSTSTSRRRTFAALGAILLGRALTAQAATQIQVPACGAAGAVCTLMHGCCSGLTCATSGLNPAYGVCVTGSGGMAQVSDHIVVPKSEGLETELAQEVTEAKAASDAAIAAATTEETERQTRIDTRRATKDTRRTTQRTERQTRADTQQTTKQTRRTTRRTNEAPQISLEFFHETPAPAASPTPPATVTPTATMTPTPTPKGQPEIVRVRNLEDVDVVISRIESMHQPHVFSTSSITVPAGGTHLLESGRYVPDRAPSGASIWTKENVCPPIGVGGGVNLTAAQTGSTVKHRFSVLCGGTASYTSTDTVNTQQRKNNKDQQQRHNERRRERRQKRQDRQRVKHQKGSNGR